MAEDGRPSRRGHCLAALPRALWLFVTRVALRPDRWKTDPYPPEAAEAPDPVDEHAATIPVERVKPWEPNAPLPRRQTVIKHVIFAELGHDDDTWVGNLRYRRDDPYAVTAHFGMKDGEPIVWRFARDLLHHAVIDHERAGLHDVRVYERDRSTLVLELRSPDGAVDLTTDRAAVFMFLHETYSVVPRGEESAEVDLDAALAELLDGEVR